MSRFPAIPDFSGTLESLTNSARAMKSILDLITGQRHASAPAAVSLTYFQPTPPGNQKGFIAKGDFWINSDTGKLWYWSGVEWKATL